MKSKVLFLFALLVPLAFGACTTVRKDDHSYTYIYQHNTSLPIQTRSCDGSGLPPMLADAQSQPVRAEPYGSAPRMAGMASSEADLSDNFSPVDDLPRRTYYEIPQPQTVRPVYRLPVLAGPYYRSERIGTLTGRPSPAPYFGYSKNTAPTSYRQIYRPVCMFYPQGR